MYFSSARPFPLFRLHDRSLCAVVLVSVSLFITVPYVSACGTPASVCTGLKWKHETRTLHLGFSFFIHQITHLTHKHIWSRAFMVKTNESEVRTWRVEFSFWKFLYSLSF